MSVIVARLEKPEDFALHHALALDLAYLLLEDRQPVASRFLIAAVLEECAPQPFLYRLSYIWNYVAAAAAAEMTETKTTIRDLTRKATALRRHLTKLQKAKAVGEDA